MKEDDDDFAALHEDFFAEASEHAVTLEALLLGIEGDVADDELVAAAFRAAHSIKGSAGMLGFKEISRFTHALETLLDALRSGAVAWSREIGSALLEGVDVIRQLLAGPDARLDGAGEATRTRLLTLARGESGTHTIADLVAAFGDVSAELRSAIGGALMLQRAPPVISVPDEPPSGPPSRPGDSDAVAPPRPSLRPSLLSAGLDAATVRVATKKLDQMLDLVGELIVATSVLGATLARPSTADQVSAALGALGRRTHALQESVMAVRRVPVAALFGRFPRVVRELGAALDKDVVLELEGTETEIDREIAELLADPLTHLVRNAVDHGLESAELRAAAGKPRAGQVVLSASAQAGRVVIEVRDDGCGLDLDRVREKAVARGLLHGPDLPGRERLHALVFEPGFSTAPAVTDVSGRGVGLDVVKRNVEALGGTICFTSEWGVGSRVRLELPPTMAGAHALLVRVGGTHVAIPAAAVVEALRPGAGAVSADGGTLAFRGRSVSLVPLAEVLPTGERPTEPLHGTVVVVEGDGATCGLVVDEVLSDADAVVRHHAPTEGRRDGLAGATVSVDGAVTLVLDVCALLRRDGSRTPAGRRAA